MPEVGVEPTRPCGHGILSPARLPFRHSGILKPRQQRSAWSVANGRPVNHREAARSPRGRGGSPDVGVLSRASAIPPLRHAAATNGPRSVAKGSFEHHRSALGPAGGLARCRGSESRVCHSATPAQPGTNGAGSVAKRGLRAPGSGEAVVRGSWVVGRRTGAGGLARCRGSESRVCHSATPAS